jgi:hypothetical protein
VSLASLSVRDRRMLPVHRGAGRAQQAIVHVGHLRLRDDWREGSRESGPAWAVTAVDVKSQSVEILLDGITDGMFTPEMTGSKTTVRTKGPVITIDAKLGGFAPTEGKFVTVKGTLTCQQP